MVTDIVTSVISNPILNYHLKYTIMKTRNWALIPAFITILCACQNSMDEFINEKIQTRSNTEISWADCSECMLRNGQMVRLPWASSIVTTIPDEIRTDIEEENNWRILYTNVDIIGYDEKVTQADEGVNYLLFYNQHTGILKGFLYIENTIEGNNNAFWLLSVSKGSKLFNFVSSDFALPLDSNDTSDMISVSTITKNGLTTGFEQGWNCFMVELAYDENSMNQKLDISGYVIKESTYEISGSYKSTSEGTFVTSTSGPSSTLKGTANAIGNAGKTWLINNIGLADNPNKPIKTVLNNAANLIGKGISGIITLGLQKVFGSLVGSTTTTYDFQYTTNGEISIQGKSQTPLSGIIKNIAGIPLNGIGKRLGVWNLKTTPEYNINAPAQYKGIEQNGNQVFYQYNVYFQSKYEVVTNPDLEADVSYNLYPVNYKKYKGKTPDFVKTTYSSDITTHSTLHPNVQTLYEDSTTIIEDKKNSCIVSSNQLPNRTYQANTPALIFPDCKFNVSTPVVFKILATVKDHNNTYYSSKSFIPLHGYINQNARSNNWSYEDLENIENE